MLKIGFTGASGAGKDTLAEYLAGKGFRHFSLSEFIRAELENKNMSVTRDNLRATGNRMREKEGYGVLAKLAIESMSEDGNYVITSIRHPLEVEALEDSRNFVLIAVEAPIETRFKRIMERNGRDEKKTQTIEEFKTAEALEMESSKESSQHVKACMEMASLTIVNDCDTKTLFEKLDMLMPNIKEMAAK